MKTHDIPLDAAKPAAEPVPQVQALQGWETGVWRSRALVLFRAFSDREDEAESRPFYGLSTEQAVALRDSLDEALRDLAAGPRPKPGH